MTVDATFWWGFIAALIVLGGLVGWLARTGRLPQTSGDGRMTKAELEQRLVDFEQRLTERDSTIKVILQERGRDAREIEQLKRELAEAKERIRFLEGRLAQYETEEPGMSTQTDVPLLALFGVDERITGPHLAAIRQAGIPFRRVLKATKRLVEEELLRRREDGTLYRWLHISTHAGPQGMELADGIAEPEWWNEWMAGLEGVFLTGCTDVKVADWLIGCVGWVVSTYEDVNSDLACRFVRAFWSAMNETRKNMSPREAYRAACKAVPQFAEYTDFRQRPSGEVNR